MDQEEDELSVDWLQNFDVEAAIREAKRKGQHEKPKQSTQKPLTRGREYPNKCVNYDKRKDVLSNTRNSSISMPPVPTKRCKTAKLEVKVKAVLEEEDNESLPKESGDADGLLLDELKKLFGEDIPFWNADFQYLLSKGMKRLLPYQKRGIARILSLGARCLVFDEMGLGKSVQALFAVTFMCMSEECKLSDSDFDSEKEKPNSNPNPKPIPAVLIIVPGALRTNWNAEIEKWLPMFSLEEVQVLKSRKDTLNEGSRFIICSYRMLGSHISELMNYNFKCVVVDESHRTRTHNSSQSYYISCICEQVPHVLLLTGTPMLIRPFELFVQLDIILKYECKNLLVPSWGRSSYGGTCTDLSQNDRSLPKVVRKKPSSHLEELIESPFTSMQEINSALRLDAAQEVVDQVVVSNSHTHKSLQAKWSGFAPETKLFAFNTIKKLAEFIFFTLRDIVGPEKARSKPWFAPLKKLSYLNLVNANQQPIQMHVKLCNELRKLWRQLTTEDSYLSNRLAKMWDAHRFGVLYCNGTLKRYRRKGVKYMCQTWEYNGSNKSLTGFIVSVIRKYMIRRKKKHVLKDLPQKIRSHVLLNLEKERENIVRENPSLENADNSVISEEMNHEENHHSTLKTLAGMTNIPSYQLTFELQRVGITKAPFIADYLIRALEVSDISKRFIVFAVHIKVLEIIKQKLEEQRGNDPSFEKYFRYGSELCTGAMPTNDRAAVVNEFQNNEESGPRVLLLSILAMGVGFTLTRSSTVIMCELHWSPQVLKQAEDRAHRIGQNDTVFVQYMCAPNTLDEKLWPIISSRMQRIESTLANTSNYSRGMSENHTRHSKTIAKTRTTDEIGVDYQMTQNQAIEQLDLHLKKTRVLSMEIKGVSKSDLSQKTNSQNLSQTQALNMVGDFSPAQLCFKVNSVTGRVHLYKSDKCETVPSGSFTHLKENFSPGDFMFIAEEWLRHALGKPAPCRQMLCLLPPRLRNPNNEEFTLVQAFVREWAELHIMNQNKLFRLKTPIRSPLMLELAKYDSTENSDALEEKIGKDVASFDRISHPEHQMHRSACRRHGRGSYIVRRIRLKQKNIKSCSSAQSSGDLCYHQAFLKKSGKPLCLFCGTEYGARHFNNNDSLATVASLKLLDHMDAEDEDTDVENILQTINIKGGIKSLFCQGDSPCYQSWHLKCFKSSARGQLRALEKGVCRRCNTDTITMFRRAQAFPPGSANRLTALTCSSSTMEQASYCPHIQRINGTKVRMHWSKQQMSLLSAEYKAKIVSQPRLTEGLFWDADHILAVCLGGGSASLDNFQTLCKPCHRVKTKSDLYKRSLKTLGARVRRHLRMDSRNIKTKNKKKYCKPCDIEFENWEEVVSHELICPYIDHFKSRKKKDAKLKACPSPFSSDSEPEEVKVSYCKTNRRQAGKKQIADNESPKIIVSKKPETKNKYSDISDFTSSSSSESDSESFSNLAEKYCPKPTNAKKDSKRKMYFTSK